MTSMTRPKSKAAVARELKAAEQWNPELVARLRTMGYSLEWLVARIDLTRERAAQMEVDGLAVDWEALADDRRLDIAATHRAGHAGHQPIITVKRRRSEAVDGLRASGAGRLVDSPACDTHRVGAGLVPHVGD